MPPLLSPSILDETQPLRQVLVWGEPGIETLLGQLLPKTRSLFHSYYDVLEARREFRHMQDMITAQGAEVLRAKDALLTATAGRVYPSMPGSVHALRRALDERAALFHRYFGAQKAR
ncbi:MAG: hypothetical protein WHV44_00670, partial [Anaerolineales bacterium]